jgi:hypothetical protein
MVGRMANLRSYGIRFCRMECDTATGEEKNRLELWQNCYVSNRRTAYWISVVDKAGRFPYWPQHDLYVESIFHLLLCVRRIRGPLLRTRYVFKATPMQCPLEPAFLKKYSPKMETLG